MDIRRSGLFPDAGYTLMEMILVLAILVVAAAASAPALSGVMKSATLTSAADTVRTQWTRAHVLAMKTGRVHVFRYELGGAKYKIEPWLADDDELESTSAQNAMAAAAGAQAPPEMLQDKTIPEGTQFYAGDLAADNRSLTIEAAIAQMPSDGGEWSRPILFFPDGSSSDAYVLVGDSRQVGIRVDLRGLTGVVKVGDIQPLANLEQK